MGSEECKCKEFRKLHSDAFSYTRWIMTNGSSLQASQQRFKASVHTGKLEPT
jgi:hypothetical protein